MARYIDLDKAIERLNVSPGFRNMGDGYFLLGVVKDILNNMPIADVVEVVRCKDCRMFVDNKEALVTYCKRECKNLTVKPTDFCSYGERKE